MIILLWYIVAKSLLVMGIKCDEIEWPQNEWTHEPERAKRARYFIDDLYIFLWRINARVSYISQAVLCAKWPVKSISDGMRENIDSPRDFTDWIIASFPLCTRTQFLRSIGACIARMRFVEWFYIYTYYIYEKERTRVQWFRNYRVFCTAN